jgi:hypothetical protein
LAGSIEPIDVAGLTVPVDELPLWPEPVELVGLVAFTGDTGVDEPTVPGAELPEVPPAAVPVAVLLGAVAPVGVPVTDPVGDVPPAEPVGVEPVEPVAGALPVVLEVDDGAEPVVDVGVDVEPLGSAGFVTLAGAPSP